MRIGWPEILLIVALVLILFGAKKIPDLMKSIGRGAREFKEGLRDEDDKEKNKDSNSK